MSVLGLRDSRDKAGVFGRVIMPVFMKKAMSDRVRGYLDWGVEAVWVVDPVTRHVHQFHGRHMEQMLKDPQVLLGQTVLPGFATGERANDRRSRRRAAWRPNTAP